MLPVTIRTTDPATGAEVDPPAATVQAVRDMNEWLGSVLGPLTETFGVRADWQFTRPGPGRVEAEAVLTAEPNITIRQHVPEDRLTDTVSVRQALWPAFTTLGRELMRASEGRIQRAQEALRRSLDAYAAAGA